MADGVRSQSSGGNEGCVSIATGYARRRRDRKRYVLTTLIRTFPGARPEVTLQREERETPWCLTDNALPCDTPQLAAGRLHFLQFSSRDAVVGYLARG